ncbi:hypothetical protein BDB00DRAFT_789857 [Zychaea mexicana]|uniref:uncharacterized protein n=1 Tax=Zychaea mexicana TaxID=64656 RepID=UPI0022FEA912|nr:uncharacterized protein BDB00DRAFT_789857 [Zychaea mexicana]KAI9491063.1 hypothetical protein BDB00DRAFT_789857 [Zychaea mexicana]
MFRCNDDNNNNGSSSVSRDEETNGSSIKNDGSSSLLAKDPRDPGLPAVNSFVLDVGDPVWKDILTDEQYAIITSAGNRAFLPLSSAVKAIFDLTSAACKAAIKAQEVKALGPYNPYDECDEDWLQDLLLRFLHLYRWNVVNWVSTSGSEMDFVAHVWSLLDECFESLNVQTRRDQTCIATSTDENRGRVVNDKAVENQRESSDLT